MSDQMVFKRYELKYIISKSQRDLIREKMTEYMIADEHGKSTILSLYMDTPEFLLARRSIDHPFYKEKLRLRSYGVAREDTTVFLELKKKYDGITYKRRTGMKEAELELYLKTGIVPEDSQIMRELDFAKKRYRGIRPAVLLSYEREAFYAKDDHGFRMTFDENILWRDTDVSLCCGVYGMPLLKEDQVLLEVKAADAIPYWLVELFSACKIYKTSFSKYGAAYRNICRGVQTEQTEILTNGGIYQYA